MSCRNQIISRSHGVSPFGRLSSGTFPECLEYLDKPAFLNLRLTNRTFSTLCRRHVVHLVAEEMTAKRGIIWNTGSYIHNASKKGLHEIMSLLLSLKVPVNEVDMYGETALHVAARSGCETCIRSLFHAGADIDVQSRQEWTPLMLAARYGHVEAVVELIRDGASLNQRGFHGWTALHVAGQHGHQEVRNLLIEAGSSVEVKDNDGAKAGTEASFARCWG
ncbi:uncharacterized protein CTRU02_212694 [Colletotrichum truncatum]|uniref:Uncharacterized protein n=1 Tax=Colletotrichum truncatum TaxID=5467 RepID=A0ACC3YIM0_COLTU|nr:uncharacterized protein CTRU02_05233 [Colletotrichum truncatum]KAF6794401.1 hypothetical protein CTRU02_05233 [Colletotrichum truncatum]